MISARRSRGIKAFGRTIAGGVSFSAAESAAANRTVGESSERARTYFAGDG